MTKYIIANIIAIVTSITCYAFQPAMGEWRIHLAYTDITEVAQTKEKVYGLSNGALFSVDKHDHIVEMLSKLSGLSDSDISHIAYSPYNKVLMIAYQNSNIDLINDDNEIINISDIYRKTFNGDKSINGIAFTADYAYLATGFGVIVINLARHEIADTYTIGDNGGMENIVSIAVSSTDVYALGKTMLKRGALRGVNLSNFNNWANITLPAPSVANKQIEIVGDTIFLIKTNNTLYKRVNGVWSGAIANVSAVRYDNGVLFTSHPDRTITAPAMPTLSGANYASYDATNKALWYSTAANITRINIATGETNYFAPNGPATNDAWEMAHSNGRIMVVPGGRFASEYGREPFISFFENEQWRAFWPSQFNSITPTFRPCKDIVDIEVDPNDKSHFFAASYGMGLYEFRNDQIYKLYNCDVTDVNGKGIESIFPNGNQSAKYGYQRVDALQFDTDGNLWLYNTSAVSSIKMLDKNGVFHYFPHSEIINAPTIERIIISSLNPNIKFVSLPRYTATTNSAIFVFDDRGTIDNIKDDQTRLFTEFIDQDGKKTSLAQRFVRSIAQDKDGVIWVGTTEGIVLLNDLNNIFSSNFRSYKIKIPRNDGSNLADYLLETEQINDIAVDAANRKWIATQNSGVFLVSEDGLETIHHFTTDDSPLLSNTVITIGINDQTGEVFFGTDLGIISYQSDSNEGGTSFTNVHAFPNPVRPEFRGIISITGLTDGTNVRITDVNGNLIYETTSNGGFATWDGCRRNGDRVATGIYFAHCTAENRRDKTIVKIMIIN